MGASLTTYLGPYLVGHFDTVARMVKTSGCPTCKTDVRFKKFCEECGHTIENYELEKKVDSVERWEVSRKVPRFSIQGAVLDHIFIPNEGFELERHFQFGNWHENPEFHGWHPRGPGEDTLSEVDEEIDRFKEVYKEEIYVLRNIYGDEHFALLWGVVNYWS